MKNTGKSRFYLTLICVLILVPFAESKLSAVWKVSCHKQNLPSNYALSALGKEFRTVAANLLWIKVDKYHHEFIEKNKDWRENKDILPLIKTITALDPHFVEAYLTGSWILGPGLKNYTESVQYLKEGISHNPDAWELHSQLAILYSRYMDQHRLALKEAETALNLARTSEDRKIAANLRNALKRIVEEGR